MGVIELYAGLCFAIALMASVDLFHPIIKEYEMSTDIRVLHYFISFVISLLVAPILLYPCISSSAGIEFRAAYESAVMTGK